MSDRAVATNPVNLDRIEAPVTLKAYLMCAFSAFGGVFFGYDSGYINGVMGMPYFIKQIEGPDAISLTGPSKGLITSILSLGTFIGALVAGDFADAMGRRSTVLASCVVFLIGVMLQLASAGLSLLLVGRAVAGLGVGGVSAIIILYMSEIAPRKVRGAIVSAYQFFITVEGLLLASAVDYATKSRDDSGSYRIPISIQMIWALILASGLYLLPESPRFYVRKGELDRAADSLSRLRGQDVTSDLISDELAEIIVNHELECSLQSDGGYWSTWLMCVDGSLQDGSSKLRRTILGTSLQMISQWTGVNFVFYFGTTLFVVAIIGTFADSAAALSVMVTFICIFIFCFASTWGPGSWVLIGEIFPLSIRARGVALSTASNWLWNFIIGLITPYMVDEDKGNLGARVFYIWGGLCAIAFIYTWFLVPETKGLTLEQVDRMLEETTSRTSATWTPYLVYDSDIGLEKAPIPESPIADVDRKAKRNPG
ncbi:hypothetical protein ONZ43_g3593 [Nemania bipapillata]|uniref:Uncharacterized protein n=1 Tax=Nemania bipapillata TaxID=110536 RepID=A0ACC2IWB4_9PEZI|nr:hypothetical protein ONZ43_g3593 [Nemania bipapillata]